MKETFIEHAFSAVNQHMIDLINTVLVSTGGT
jgi:hypothetical protein